MKPRGIEGSAVEHQQDEGKSKKWYEEDDDDDKVYKEGKKELKQRLSEVETMELKTKGKRYLEAETAINLSKESKRKDSEASWLRTALTKGTESDKIAASIVLVQNNPKYNLSRLSWLVSRVKCGKRNQSGMLVLSLKELFLSELLHPRRKLRKFEEQETLGKEYERGEKGKKLMARWYFEDALRGEYERFVNALVEMASDTVEANRERAITVMSDLLIGNGEQEGKLLEALINKIGDPRSVVASKAVFSLNRVLLEHPRMKLVVMRRIEKFLFRNNIAPRAQYYAICLLTRFILERGSGDDDDDNEKLASTLIEIYFGFFRACLKRGEPDSRMMAAILSGVNRAYPFAANQLRTSSIFDEHIHSVYKIVHQGSFNVSLNALNLLHQIIVVGKQEAERENRFYMAFYRKLTDPRLAIANKRAVFINLLYRVLRDDKNVKRLYVFVKRILQITLYFPASMACATLYVISQLFKARKDLKRMYDRDYRVKEEQVNENDETIEGKNESSSSSSSSSNNILWNVQTERIDEVNENKDHPKCENETELPYDPYSPNPLKSGATVIPWEIVALQRHFHPSVSLFANAIVEQTPIEYSGDPLTDLSLVRFLDRYAFKNPKKNKRGEDEEKEGVELLEEAKTKEQLNPLARRSEYLPSGPRSIPVDSEAYLNEPQHRIPPDELFLYRYLRQKNETRPVSAAQDESDNESVNSDEFNELLDSYGASGRAAAADEFDLDELDIAADIASSVNYKHNKKTGNTAISDDEDDDDDDDDDEESELDYDDDLSMSDADQDSYSDIDFDEDGNNESSDYEKEKESGRRKTKKKSNIFVAAEEFGEMLEEQARSKHKHGGSNALSVADGATSKQLDWELARNQRLQPRKRPRNMKHEKFNKRFKKFK